MQIRPGGEQRTDTVSVALSEARLRELLGAEALPDGIRAVIERDDPHPLVSCATTPRLLGLLDEIANADAKGASRLLWHEAKALELLASITDELSEAARASAPHLSAYEIDRVERARACLLERLDAPPTLSELARRAGFRETKLKGAFRARFGRSIFAYLREARMDEAKRLLLTRRLNVTEVSTRVGYANPSKFAAAFRRRFGFSPSDV